MPNFGAFTGVLKERGSELEILLLERGDEKGWSLPGGGVEAGENCMEGAERETRKKTGLLVRIIAQVGKEHDLLNGDGEITDTDRAYSAIVIGGELKRCKEYGRFTQEELGSIKIIDPEPLHKGCMRTMIKDLFNAGIPAL